MDSSYLPLITGSGGALVVLAIGLYLFISGKIHSDREFSRVEAGSARKDETIERLQEALDLERQRSNDATQAGTVTNQLIGGLVALATEHRAAEQHEHKEAEVNAGARPVLDLTGKDVGL